MKIIRNRILPFGKGFVAINLFGIVFAKEWLSASSRNHEYIHTLQQREMLFVLFYLWYGVEWLVRLLQYRNGMRAYCNISFEREAYAKMYNPSYAHTRRHFAWTHYLTQRISH